MGKIITFGTLKGGTGKSTTAFSTAGILAESGKKVLVIDVDPQANVTTNFGLDETVEGYHSIKDVFENDKIPIENIIYRAPIKELPTLDVIGSTILLTSTEMRVISYAGREFLLKNYFKRNKEKLDEYDYIIFDTNPSLSIINQNSFIICDAIILVSDIGMNSFKGLQLFIALWEDILGRLDIEDNIKGILVNKYDKRNGLSERFTEYCKDDEDIKRLIFDSYIPINVKLMECELQNKPINLVDKKSAGYVAFNNFIDELVNRI